jgi:hypothetical protein
VVYSIVALDFMAMVRCAAQVLLVNARWQRSVQHSGTRHILAHSGTRHDGGAWCGHFWCREFDKSVQRAKLSSRYLNGRSAKNQGSHHSRCKFSGAGQTAAPAAAAGAVMACLLRLLLCIPPHVSGITLFAGPVCLQAL